MVHFLASLVCLLVIASGFPANAADPNCSKNPQLSTILACCMKQPQLSEIDRNCANKSNQQGSIINPCYAECIFNSYGLLVNGEVLWDKVKAMFAEKYKGSPDFVPVMERALKKCEQMTKSKLANKIGAPTPGPDNCHPIPVLIARCMLVETFLDCPASKWQNNEECNNAKGYFKSCPMPKPTS